MATLEHTDANLSWREKLLIGACAFGYVLALVFLLLWANRTDQNWDMGSMPDWLTAIFTGLGLAGVAVAAWQLRGAQRDSHKREERERKAQASRVYWRVDRTLTERTAGTRWSRETHFVVNGSDEPITNAAYIAVEPNGSGEILTICSTVLTPHTEEFGAEFEYTDLEFPPGVRTSLPLVSRKIESTAPWDVAIIFSDSSARSWVRMPDLVVERIENYTTTAEVVGKIKVWRRKIDARQQDRKVARVAGATPAQ